PGDRIALDIRAPAEDQATIAAHTDEIMRATSSVLGTLETEESTPVVVDGVAYMIRIKKT
ncbi:MAG: hypothetical protein U1A28_00875, partial [Patescibacteria group bacterium]|nr:hypothetical protein [Patescibacteria group bacterium]